MWTTTAEQTNIYVRSKIRTNYQRMDAIDAMIHFRCRQHTHHNIWRDVNSAYIKVFMAYSIIIRLVQKSKVDHPWSTCNFTKTPFFDKYMSYNDLKTFCGGFIFLKM